MCCVCDIWPQVTQQAIGQEVGEWDRLGDGEQELSLRRTTGDTKPAQPLAPGFAQSVSSQILILYFYILLFYGSNLLTFMQKYEKNSAFVYVNIFFAKLCCLLLGFSSVMCSDLKISFAHKKTVRETQGFEGISNLPTHLNTVIDCRLSPAAPYLLRMAPESGRPPLGTWWITWSMTRCAKLSPTISRHRQHRLTASAWTRPRKFPSNLLHLSNIVNLFKRNLFNKSLHFPLILMQTLYM